MLHFKHRFITFSCFVGIVGDEGLYFLILILLWQVMRLNGRLVRALNIIGKSNVSTLLWNKSSSCSSNADDDADDPASVDAGNTEEIEDDWRLSKTTSGPVAVLDEANKSPSPPLRCCLDDHQLLFCLLPFFSSSSSKLFGVRNLGSDELSQESRCSGCLIREYPSLPARALSFVLKVS
jgi:hypothetical protein